VALRTFRETKGSLGWLEAVQFSKDPTLFTVLFEDTAAMSGLLVASAGIALSQFIDMPILDPDRALEQQRQTQHQIIDPRAFNWVGHPDFSDALDDGNPGADAENQHGDDEDPEIELEAVTEGMPGICRARGAPHAEQQEKLVAAVHRGMNRLAEHRGAAGQAGGDELRHRDQHITSEGGVDNAFGRRSGHSSSYSTAGP
jgi:hypothetical protein